MSNNKLADIVNIVSVISGCVGALFAVIGFKNNGQTVEAYLSIAVSIISFSFLIYVHILWRIPHFSKVPVISGWYEVSITPREGSNPKAVPVIGKMHISQSYIKCIVTIIFVQSSSSSIYTAIDGDINRFMYTYTSKTKATEKKINPDKTGTADLTIISKNELRGTYFTTEFTGGDMHCIRKKKKDIIPKVLKKQTTN